MVIRNGIVDIRRDPIADPLLATFTELFAEWFGNFKDRKARR